MLAALTGVPAAASLDVTQQAVCSFLDEILGHASSTLPPGTLTKGAAPAVAGLALVPAAAASPGGTPLRLHPRVDLYHPLGEAHSAQQALDALALYRRLLKGTYLEVEDVVSSGDKALAVGTQHVSSYLVDAAQLAPHILRTYLGPVLPKVAEGRVPTAVQLSFGKDDAGNPVVTKMTVTFNLLAALLPHLELRQWQQKQLEHLRPLLLQALLGMGQLSAVAEDIGAVAGAAWRTVSTMVGTTVSSALAAVRGGAAAAGTATSMVTGRQCGSASAAAVL